MHQAYLIYSPVVTEGPSTARSISNDQMLCRKTWWHNLLFVHNLTARWFLDQCYPASWYLSADFQLWVTAPAFVVLGYNYKKTAMALASLICISSIAYIWYARPLIFWRIEDSLGFRKNGK